MEVVSLFRFLSLSVSGRAAPEEHQEQYSHHSLYTLHSCTLLYTIGKLWEKLFENFIYKPAVKGSPHLWERCLLQNKQCFPRYFATESHHKGSPFEAFLLMLHVEGTKLHTLITGR